MSQGIADTGITSYGQWQDLNYQAALNYVPLRSDTEVFLKYHMPSVLAGSATGAVANISGSYRIGAALTGGTNLFESAPDTYFSIYVDGTSNYYPLPSATIFHRIKPGGGAVTYVPRIYLPSNRDYIWSPNAAPNLNIEVLEYIPAS
jgi:hypothetical protein